MAPILVICGTNRPGASAHKVADIVHRHYAAANVPASYLSLVELPPEAFSPEAYGNKPAKVVEIQKRVLDASGLHLVVPEYNGSFPGVLKYFIDLLKFPESFQHKPVAFVGEAAGMWGALRSVEQLQQIFAYRNAYLYPDRVFIPNVNAKLDGEGRLIDPDIDSRLAKQAVGFKAFIETMTAS